MKKTPLVLLLALATDAVAQQAPTPGQRTWLQPTTFSLGSFGNPAGSYGPLTRWWWPGNLVTKTELQREINLFADYGFAGVEVQALQLPTPMTSDERRQLQTVDGPEYYENLRAMLDEARKRHLVVDLTDGSGWPPGGSYLTPEDGFLSLEFAAVTVAGGQKARVALPRVPNPTPVPARLQAVLAAKTRPKAAGDTSRTVPLDEASVRVLTAGVRHDTLTYELPAGSWQVIAFWSIPSNEQTAMAATRQQGPVLDHLDSVKVRKNYTHLFGARTGLAPYFGNPVRAIFNDSYEFKANRHYAPDFLAYFKAHRGYDITPYLPANMQKGYNFVEFMRPNAQPDFTFSDQDWRLRHDYDLTVSELLGEHFFNTSRTWAETRGLLHRTQGYGLNMDMIGMAGLASIPETESMLGPEANLKVMTSGALLYNKPIMTAEAAVFMNQAYTTTPQTVRLAVDKLFAAGVNQVVYHGVPYRRTSERLGTEGWYPFSTPALSLINFSSNLGEGNRFWPDQPEVNQYVRRVQYALRAGKPHADVLVYYPFLNVEDMPDNPEEIFTLGTLGPATPPPVPPVAQAAARAKQAWAAQVYPLLNELEHQGLSWQWVNDASLQAATPGRDGQFAIRGNTFQALILANAAVLPLPTAEHLKDLSRQGLRLLATGELPTRQPSYLRWQENDRKTAQAIQAALKGKNSRYLRQPGEWATWLRQLTPAVRFSAPYPFTRQTQRELPDGSRVQFIWNKSAQWQNITLALGSQFKRSYWLNADAGTTTPNAGPTVSYQLPPYGSVLLYAATTPAASAPAAPAAPVVNPTRQLLALEQWRLKTDSVELKNTPLFDWKTNPQLRYSAAEGVYTASFEWRPPAGTAPYFLDLGQVAYTAEVFLNGQRVGKRIYSPYVLDISRFLKPGANTLTVRVAPGQLNGYLNQARHGDPRYKQFKDRQDQVMSGGLLGPVVIRPGRVAE
ncbi:glycosyl hydrolase [Hymenobacter monticola]|uniref:Beta-mannosidase-like galactose-binding domain-containing protein n=1 Tax=Hymenobacter monticola TaxID=1705399 RepID=A0ABY4BDL9_9BACT|nr:glycosyl hydrolase [Hymenobacter monticola]UOE36407.1 hypothetical protein MTP16_23910 [Hymenobacter monticola]